jgi:predicted TIM-barrel fold metal-dependent hydrolase
MVQMRVEDERQHYPLMKVPGVSAEGVIALANKYPSLRIICLCAYLREAEQHVSGTENVWVDTAFIEYMDTIRHTLDRIPANRLLFGSHTPFLYTRANAIKLDASGAPKRALNAIAYGNVRRLLRGR